jgi:uncharacterized RDD family membrane protein YckC
MTEIVINNQNENNGIEIAKKRYRILAFLIDFIIIWLIGMIIGIFFGTPHEDGIGYNFNGLPAFAWMCCRLFLWSISEALWGQTIGKRLLELKVVSNDFRPIGMGQAFGRFFLGFIDYMFLIGLIISSINKLNKRIGDMAANTVVIKLKKPTHKQWLYVMRADSKNFKVHYKKTALNLYISKQIFNQ